MTRILLYTTPFCGYCRAAKRLLRRKGLDFEEIDVGFDPDKRAEMIERAHGLAHRAADLHPWAPCRRL